VKVAALDTYRVTQVYHRLRKSTAPGFSYGRTYCGHLPVDDDSFYRNEAEAQKAGLRRCKNCQWGEQEETNG